MPPEAAHPELTQLRAHLSRLQKDLDRKDKRLTKAVSRSAKLEGLLMQTEGEADQLRSTCAHTKEQVDHAKRVENDLLGKMENDISRFNRDCEALKQKSDGLAEELSRKLQLIDELKHKVGDAHRLVRERERDLVSAQEEQQAREAAMSLALADKVQLVSRLQAQLAEDQQAHQTQLGQVSEQRDLQQSVLAAKENKCITLRAKLEDSTLAIYNLQLRLKEAHHDSEVECQELGATLSAKESNVSSLEKLLADKARDFKLLSADASSMQAALEQSNCALSESEQKLQSTERFLETVQGELSDLSANTESENAQLQNSLAAKSAELAATKERLAAESSASERTMFELSHKHGTIQGELAQSRDEMAALSSRLEGSQRALHVAQRSLSETTASSSERVRSLESKLAGKQDELQRATCTLEEQSSEYAAKLQALEVQVRHSSANIEERDTKVSQLQEQLRQSEETLIALRDEINESTATHVSREHELQSMLTEKCKELETLNVNVEKSAEEYRVLQAAHETAQSNLKEAESTAKHTISALEAQLDTSVQRSKEATSQCAELQNRLIEMEHKHTEQVTELKRLQGVQKDYKNSEAEHASQLQALQKEKVIWNRKSVGFQEKLRAYEKEKADVLENLKIIHSERDDFTACIEDLKEASAKSVLEAQEDAAKEIADISFSNEVLQEQLEKKQKESEVALEQMQNVQEELLESKRVADEAKKSLAEMSVLKNERIDAEHNLHDAKQKLEQINEQFRQLSEERKNQEVILTQEIRLKDSTLESKDELLKQLREDLERMNSKVLDLESENSKMKSAISDSNLLLLRAGKENEEVVTVLASSQAEFEKTLDSTSRMLKASQRSEQVSKTAYRLLLDRLHNLRTSCGLEVQEKASSPSDLHSEVNLVIAKLEEHFQGGRYLEVELANVTKLYDHQKESNQNLLRDNDGLRSSLDEVKNQLKYKTEEQDTVSLRERDAQNQLSSLNEKLSAHDEREQKLTQENSSLQQTVNNASEKLVAKDDEIALISSREEKAIIIAQQLRQLADATAESLADQDHAAEIALTSLQRRQKELEAEVSKSESDMKVASQNLQDACRDRDAISAELEVLRETHRALVDSQDDGKQQWRERIDALEARLGSSEEELHSHETSSMKALADARALTEAVETRCQKAEHERAELQRKLKDAAQVQTEKSALEASLSEKEIALKQHHEELQTLNRAVASLEAERDSLQERYVAEQKEAEALFEKKFSEASANEDEKIRTMKSKLQAAQSDSQSLRQEMAALREKLQSEQTETIGEVAALSRKFEAAKTAHELAKSQKEDVEEELRRRTEINDEHAATIGKLQEELTAKASSASALAEKLGSAEVSITALEAKVKSAEEAVVKNSREHSAAVDELLIKLESQRSKLEITLSSKKDGDLIAEKGLAEIERLEHIVEELKEESRSAKAEAVHFESLIISKAEEMATAQEALANERDALQRKCTELSGKIAMNQEEIDARRSQLTEINHHLEAAHNQLGVVTEDVSRAERERKALEEALEKSGADMEELKSALQTSANDLETKVQILANAQSTIAELSGQIEIQESGTKETNQSDDSDELERVNTELQRRSERLGVRSKKLLRRLKRVEKLLAAEKRKNQSPPEESAKRQVSPSTKGMSPAMKRLRDQEHREPFSPIASNARPPRAPKPSVRHLAF